MTDDYECPDCGSPMQLRTNHRTKQPFYGCSNYPECTGTRDVGGSTKDEGDVADLLPSERQLRRDKNRWRE